jgi:ABC-type Fe3+-hydroxamate transport system substrate-binding protein
LRVVSLVPSLTETLIAWGVVPVACTRFCEQPTIAHVGGTKDPDVAAIAALAPDLVLMDREENRREDADALAALGVEIMSTHVTSVDDVDAMTAVVRSRLGLPALAASPDPPGEEVSWATAFVPIWRRPWMTCSRGTYGSSLLVSIGIVNVFADETSTYPTVLLDEVADRSPDLVLLPSEPYPFGERHVAEIAAAVPNASIRFVDGQDLFWWGARTNAARLRLAAALGPADHA